MDLLSLCGVRNPELGAGEEKKKKEGTTPAVGGLCSDDREWRDTGECTVDSSSSLSPLI